MPNYLPWLDLLRFVACALVIVNHVAPYGPDRSAESLGHNGVGLFFSISGYLIGTVLLNGYGKPAWLSKFYAARFLRIYPPLLIGLAFFGVPLVAGLNTRPDMLHNMQANLGYYLTFTAHLLSPNHGEPFGIVWTLCVEEYFYLFLPLAFWMFGPRITATLLVALIAITCVPAFEVLPQIDFGAMFGEPGRRVAPVDQTGTWFVLPVNILAGAVLAILRPQPTNGVLWIGIAGLAAVVANAIGNWFHPFGPVMGLTTTVVVWSFAVTRVDVPKVLKPGVVAGKWSYGIYLLHLPICSAALAVCRKLGLSATEPILYFGCAALLATIWASVLAGLMYWLLERPILGSRPWVYSRPKVRWLIAAVQVSLVPAGIVYWWLASGRP